MLQICMATWAAKMATEVAAVATASAGGASACYKFDNSNCKECKKRDNRSEPVK
jgi:hypothetical protein